MGYDEATGNARNGYSNENGGVKRGMAGPQAQRPASFERRGFTLIELLVVIAIIAILASLLLPGLAKANTKADLAVCRNNLRQIHISVQIYVGDYSTYPPAALWDDSMDPKPNVDRSGHMLPRTGIYACPGYNRMPGAYGAFGPIRTVLGRMDTTPPAKATYQITRTSTLDYRLLLRTKSFARAIWLRVATLHSFHRLKRERMHPLISAFSSWSSEYRTELSGPTPSNGMTLEWRIGWRFIARGTRTCSISCFVTATPKRANRRVSLICAINQRHAAE
jgi:prepilin-type N-terminal cleavage/methylation domain-containing protein